MAWRMYALYRVPSSYNCECVGCVLSVCSPDGRSNISTANKSYAVEDRNGT